MSLIKELIQRSEMTGDVIPNLNFTADVVLLLAAEAERFGTEHSGVLPFAAELRKHGAMLRDEAQERGMSGEYPPAPVIRLKPDAMKGADMPPAMQTLPKAENLHANFLGRNLFSIEGVVGIFMQKAPSGLGDKPEPVLARSSRGKGNAVCKFWRCPDLEERLRRAMGL